MSDNRIPNIGHPEGMKPQARKFPGHDDTFVNTDGIIEVMRKTNTEKARQMYRLFRRHHAQLAITRHDLTPEKRRTEALLAAIKEAGWKVRTFPVSEGGI